MTSTYYDQRRADRAAAAEQARADQAARTQQRIAADTAAAAIRRADRAADADRTRADREDRRDRHRKWWRALPGRLTALALSALWATMIVLPLTLAWHAQQAFAATTLHMGVLAPLFPASVEVAAWVCVLEAHRRSATGHPVGTLPRWAWVLAGVASAINVSHGIATGGLPAGLSLGVLSLLGIALHSIRDGLDRAAHAGGLAAVRRAWLRRVRYPRLSLAAASLRAAREVDAVTAWRLAWEDRYGVGPDAPRRERRLARLIVGREDKDARTAARNGELSIVGGRVRLGFAPAVKAFVDAERHAAVALAEQAEEHARRVIQDAQDVLTAAGIVFGPDALRSEQDTSEAPNEQVELSPRAAELLPELHRAIGVGQVPANPSATAIRAWVRTGRLERLGVPAAQELRDAVKGLHLLDQPVDVGHARDAEPAAS